MSDVNLLLNVAIAGSAVGLGSWIFNRMGAASDRRGAEMARVWLEHESVVADALEDVARMRPEVAEAAELNRARLDALRPAIEKLAARQPMTLREQLRVGCEVHRLDRRHSRLDDHS